MHIPSRFILFIVCALLTSTVFAAGSLDALFEQEAGQGGKLKGATHQADSVHKPVNLDALLQQSQQEEERRQLAEQKRKAEEAHQRQLAEEKRKAEEAQRIAPQPLRLHSKQ